LASDGESDTTTVDDIISKQDSFSEFMKPFVDKQALPATTQTHDTDDDERTSTGPMVEEVD
jgi:hypothetical protein